MTFDPKLIEAVARAMYERVENNAAPEDRTSWEEAGDYWQRLYREDAAAFLTAINATGTHWVAPWNLDEDMRQASVSRQHFGSGESYAALRTA